MELSLHGKKIVTNHEMSRIEKLSIEAGESEEGYVQKAGENIARAILHWIEKENFPTRVYLLVGKGNNGADTFAAALHLIQEKIEVIAFHPFDFDDCSTLCAKKGREYLKKGGKRIFLEDGYSLSFPEEGIIVDGIVGTGFKGSLQGILLHMVEKANLSGLPIVAIDIPSGVEGGSGEVSNSAIKADKTLFLGLPKSGLFLGDGYEHAGKVEWIDFGLPSSYEDQAIPIAYLLAEEKIKLPSVQRCRHKYDAGEVVGISGSLEMPGAAFLASMGALRAGAGLMKLFYHPDGKDAFSFLPPEIIRRDWKEIEEKKAKAYFVGPGIGRGKESLQFLRKFLPNIEKPLVIDADALYFLSQENFTFSSQEIVYTPHVGEMKKLLGSEIDNKAELIAQCQNYVEEKGIRLVLKGAPNWFFYPELPPLVIPRGDPGMATGGMGDILTGMIASFLAQGLDGYHAPIVAVFLHALSGESAAKKKSSYSTIASDLLEELPMIMLEISRKGRFCTNQQNEKALHLKIP